MPLRRWLFIVFVPYCLNGASCLSALVPECIVCMGVLLPLCPFGVAIVHCAIVPSCIVPLCHSAIVSLCLHHFVPFLPLCRCAILPLGLGLTLLAGALHQHVVAQLPPLLPEVSVLVDLCHCVIMPCAFANVPLCHCAIFHLCTLMSKCPCDLATNNATKQFGGSDFKAFLRGHRAGAHGHGHLGGAFVCSKHL